MSLSIDLDAYFRRIGYSGAREPTLETLRALHRLHPAAIPFENLDTLMGRVPDLSLEGLQAKLVEGGRGGYCFEHNGLFLAVLQALGFEAHGLAARVQWGMPVERVSPRTHMLIRLRLPDGDYLADVGFGGVVMTAPLRLQTGLEQDTGHGVLRLVEAPGDEIQMQFRTADGFQPKYQFALLPQAAVDYVLANWYIATHPDSIFTTALFCARALEDRRLGLWNNELSIRWKGGRVEKRTLDLEALAASLVEDFGLPAAAVAEARPALARAVATA